MAGPWEGSGTAVSGSERAVEGLLTQWTQGSGTAVAWQLKSSGTTVKWYSVAEGQWEGIGEGGGWGGVGEGARQGT